MEHLEKHAADVALIISEGKSLVEGNAGIVQITVVVEEEGVLCLFDVGGRNFTPILVDLLVLLL